jgi:hypothetical protein
MTYGGSMLDELRSVRQTSDGGYIVAGSTYSFGAGSSDLWVLKLDASGNVIWQKTYGGTGFENAGSVEQTADGGYIVAGSTSSFGDANSHAWVLRLDASGHIIWQRTFASGSGYDSGGSAYPTTDGGYIVAVTAYDGVVWVLKLDTDGAITGCANMGTSNATVTDSTATMDNGAVTVASSTVTPSSSPFTSGNSTETQLLMCYYAGMGGRLLVPDGTSLEQDFSTYPEAIWFAVPVEPGKTYVVDAADTNGDLTANAIGTLSAFAPDGVSPPPEASVDCTAGNGPRPPAIDVASDGIRCVIRTAPPNGTLLNKRPVFLKVTRMDPAIGGGSQFRIRVREATIYGRWLTAGYDYYVEVENTTADAMCVEVARYPASGLLYTLGSGWTGPVETFTLTVPTFGAAMQVIPTGNLVGTDSEGSLRINACASPTNLIPGGLRVTTYAFDPVANQSYIYFFTTTANEGKTRSTW